MTMLYNKDGYGIDVSRDLHTVFVWKDERIVGSFAGSQLENRKSVLPV